MHVILPAQDTRKLSAGGNANEQTPRLLKNVERQNTTETSTTSDTAAKRVAGEAARTTTKATTMCKRGKQWKGK